MAVNDIIYTADYNNIRNKVVPILGLSSGGTSGYGQTVQSVAVTESSKVTINEWANLRYDIINAYTHQNGSIPSLVQVAEGNTVKFDPTTTEAIGNILTNWATSFENNSGADMVKLASSVMDSIKAAADQNQQQ